MIWVEDTQIKVGNVVLPGLFKSIEVTTEAEIDEQEVEGSNKKKKQATGYGDAKVTIELTLEEGVNETAEYKLQKVQNLFKKSGQTKPEVYNIISGHLASRGISKVIFKSLNSKEDNSKSKITVNLEFIEWEEMTVTATKASGTTSTKKVKVAKTPKRRKAPKKKKKKKKKEAKSPAVNNIARGKDRELVSKAREKYRYRR